ncbi:hypothetical protein NXS08_05115 [Gleimia sp. 6138-11-ORH1]|uniref:hypothetical protein n=1 Tax=Gleimia sp. 6138-11-ORH1 TaxID=2973937 RepID=UPI00216A8FCD|nr:hypothetical protein [Gleimia sp. 6138-11-ORH1]MCS4484856.1 hypothetical protein [Gleimia sp. 6138-11-ORH1]
MKLTVFQEELDWTFTWLLVWMFTWPLAWLKGMGLNLVLATLYLLIFPSESNPKYDTGLYLLRDVLDSGCNYY